MLKILWKRGEIAPEEQFFLLFTIISYLILEFFVKTRIGFSLRDKRLFEITEVEITRVDCIFIFYLKAPVTPSRVSSALARSCLILRSDVRSQEIPDIFREKMACQGVVTATKALLRSSHEILSCTYGVLVGDSLRSYFISLRFPGAHNACIALLRRSHCAGGVLKTFVCTTERSFRQLFVCSQSCILRLWALLRRRLPRMM